MADDPVSVSAEPFELIANDVRVDIVTALVEHRRENPEAPSLSFSDLRERAGVRDSGQFNYHLDKLRGQFVEQTDEGYRLSPAGHEVVGAILGNTFDREYEMDPASLEWDCWRCGAPVSASYEDGTLQANCEAGHQVHGAYFPPALAERVSAERAIGLSALLHHQMIELALQDVCPNCYGPATTRLAANENDQPIFEARCDRCGLALVTSPGVVILPHPVLRRYFFDRGEDVRTVPFATVPFLTDESLVEVVDEDPLRVWISVEHDGGPRFLVDEDCTVVEHERSA